MASSDSPETEAAADDDSPSDPGRSTSSRFMRVASSLLQVHVQIAQREAAQDQARVVRGIVLLAVGGICLVTVLLLAQVVTLIALHELAGLRWLMAALAVAGGDLVVGLLLLLLGSRQLRTPVMPQTRALVRRTLTALTGS